MQNATDISTKTLMPVFDNLRTARGFRACDANDREIGVFETAGLGIVALLNRTNE